MRTLTLIGLQFAQTIGRGASDIVLPQAEREMDAKTEEELLLGGRRAGGGQQTIGLVAELADKRKKGGVIADQFQRQSRQREVSLGLPVGCAAARIHERGGKEQDEIKSPTLRPGLAHVMKFEALESRRNVETQV